MSRSHSYINNIADNANSSCYPILSAALLILALPWVGFGPAVFIALVPLFLFISDDRVTRFRALLWGAGTLLLFMFFVAYPLMRIEGSWWMGTRTLDQFLSKNFQYTVGLVVAAFWRTLVFLPVIPITRVCVRREYGPLCIAAVFTFLEWAFATFGLWGYSAGALGYGAVDVPLVKEIAALIGVYGLSFIVVLINALLARLLIMLREPGGKRTFLTSASLVLSAVVMLLVVCFGLYHRYVAPLPARHLSVAIIGTTMTTSQSISASGYQAYRSELAHALTRSPDLILLPENALPYFELREADGTLVEKSIVNFKGRDELYLDLLSLSETHASTTIAIGLHTFRDNNHYNSIVFFLAGKPVAYYEKRVLVPFTEYAPFALHIPMYVHFAQGTPLQQVEFLGQEWNALICSEIADTNMNMKKNGTILVSSNDSVFVGDAAGKMHQVMARMRAIENNVYVLRASKGGVTSVIDPHGTVLQETKEGTLFADIFVR